MTTPSPSKARKAGRPRTPTAERSTHTAIRLTPPILAKLDRLVEAERARLQGMRVSRAAAARAATRTSVIADLIAGAPLPAEEEGGKKK